MSKANYINKILVRDYFKLQNWLASRELECKQAKHELHTIAQFNEINGYQKAIKATIDFMGELMQSWPDLTAHKNSSSTMK